MTALRVNLETGALTALGQVATVTGVEFVGVVTLP